MRPASIIPARHHPARSVQRRATIQSAPLVIPNDRDEVQIEIGRQAVRLTNLRKPFWSAPRITKGDLLQYYADVSSVLLPHLHNRAMVMKRDANGMYATELGVVTGI